MARRMVGSGLFLGTWLLVAAGLGAQERLNAPGPLDPLLDSVSATRQFGEVTLSPDGRRVAYVGTRRGKSSIDHAGLFVVELEAGESKALRITAGAGPRGAQEHAPAWSPDGGRLAFLSDKDRAGQFQVYVASATGGRARRLTRLTGFLDRPRWSPDGKRIAVLFTENSPRAAGPLQDVVPDTGVVEDKIYEQRLAIIDVETSQVKQLSPPDMYVYEYDWAPDGNQLAIIAAHGSGDNNWYIAELYSLNLSGTLRQLYKPPLQIAVPRWSPDGQTIALIGGLMSDESAVGGEIFLVPAGGGPARNLTPHLKGSASWLAWGPDSQHILFAAHRDGGAAVARVSVSDGSLTEIWKTEATIHASSEVWGPSLALSRDHRVAALVKQSFTEPPEIWAGPLGAGKPITAVNEQFHPLWGEAKSLHWQNEGFTIQGWLIYPRNFDPARRYPMIVEVHGGPASAVTPHWPRSFFDFTILSHEGYFIFFPNPRGSYGQGEAFTKANVKDFGHGDLRDILAGVDQVLKTAPVDPDRLGLVGWSYGGFMTMWAVTQTQRFRAAVAGAGICNWQSYYGENGIDQWMIPYFGASVYDDPAVYAKSSAIQFIKRVRTPTLVLVGEHDVECPAPQSYEFWHALKTLKVPTQLVVYPNEGHGISKPEHQRDILKRSAGWLKKYLEAKPETGAAGRSP